MIHKNDLEQLSILTKKLYDCVEFKENEEPAIEKLNTYLIPTAKMINIDGKKPLIFSADEYILHFKELIKTGTLKKFSEIEVAHKTELFGKIAQRFSTYKTFLNDTTEKFGINSIQFIKLKDTWYISSIIWNNQSDILKIPDEYIGDL